MNAAKAKRLKITSEAFAYMREAMDMHSPLEDQGQNWILRHLVQFGHRLTGKPLPEIKTRRVLKGEKREGT